MSFARDVVEAVDPGALALVELAHDGARREWTFGEIARRSACMAAALDGGGVRRGEVVLTLIGNRPEWVVTMVACFRAGYVALPCTEQLRAKDLRLRLEVTRPSAIVCDERNRAELEAAAPSCPVLLVPDEALFAPGMEDGAPPHVDAGPADPCLITFTSGTAGEAKAVVHGQRYLDGQAAQAEHWLGARPGDVVWCTAASGWSKSARTSSAPREPCTTPSPRYPRKNVGSLSGSRHSSPSSIHSFTPGSGGPIDPGFGSRPAGCAVVCPVSVWP